MARVLCLNSEKEIVNELKRIGTHPGGIKIMKGKAQNLMILINVNNRAANILKQDMLSIGGDVAVPKTAYELDGENVEVIVIGSKKQVKALIEKLAVQPMFSLKNITAEIEESVNNYFNPLKREIGGKIFDFSIKTYLVGILNVTPDSFSDGGKFFNMEAAVNHAQQMVEDGADILDIGGESTRPGSETVSIEEEIKRVIPVIEKITSKLSVPISIDTSKPEVAQKAIDAGAAMVNDVTGLRNEKLRQFVARKNIPIIIMHMQGEPRTMQENPVYEDVVSDVYNHLKNKAEAVINDGLSPENVYIDIGIGFGKTLEHNLELIKRMAEFKSMGYPVVYGPSRKSFIGNILDLPVEERLEGTSAAVAMGIANGVSIIRVHDVKEMKRVASVTERILKG